MIKNICLKRSWRSIDTAPLKLGLKAKGWFPWRLPLLEPSLSKRRRQSETLRGTIKARPRVSNVYCVRTQRFIFTFTVRYPGESKRCAPRNVKLCINLNNIISVLKSYMLKLAGFHDPLSPTTRTFATTTQLFPPPIDVETPLESATHSQQSVTFKGV